MRTAAARTVAAHTVAVRMGAVHTEVARMGVAHAGAVEHKARVVRTLVHKAAARTQVDIAFAHREAAGTSQAEQKLRAALAESLRILVAVARRVALVAPGPADVWEVVVMVVAVAVAHASVAQGPVLFSSSLAHVAVLPSQV